MPPRKHPEFPRVVYGPNNTEKVIDNEDQRPDGFFNTREEQLANYEDDRGKAEEAVMAQERRDKAKATLDAEGVTFPNNAKTETLEKRILEVREEKKTMVDALDKHNVVIPEKATHKQLLDLTTELDSYLMQKDAEAEATKKAAEADKGKAPAKGEKDA